MKNCPVILGVAPLRRQRPRPRIRQIETAFFESLCHIFAQIVMPQDLDHPLRRLGCLLSRHHLLRIWWCLPWSSDPLFPLYTEKDGNPLSRLNVIPDLLRGFLHVQGARHRVYQTSSPFKITASLYYSVGDQAIYELHVDVMSPRSEFGILSCPNFLTAAGLVYVKRFNWYTHRCLFSVNSMDNGYLPFPILSHRFPRLSMWHIRLDRSWYAISHLFWGKKEGFIFCSICLQNFMSRN